MCSPATTVRFVSPHTHDVLLVSRDRGEGRAGRLRPPGRRRQPSTQRPGPRRPPRRRRRLRDPDPGHGIADLAQVGRRVGVGRVPTVVPRRVGLGARRRTPRALACLARPPVTVDDARLPHPVLAPAVLSTPGPVVHESRPCPWVLVRSFGNVLFDNSGVKVPRPLGPYTGLSRPPEETSGSHGPRDYWGRPGRRTTGSCCPGV